MKRASLARVAVALLAGACGLAPSRAPAQSGELRLPPPRFPEAVRLLAGGDPTAALERLDAAAPAADGRRGTAHLLLEAAAAAQAGRHAHAESTWRAIADREPALGRHVDRALARHYLTRRRADLARTQFDGLTDGQLTPADRELWLRIADRFRRQGNYQRARAEYRQLLAGGGRGVIADGARLGLALAEEAAGDWPAAAELFREAQLAHATVETYLAARAGEQRTGGARQPLTAEQFGDLVRRLRLAARYDPALELLDAWRRAPAGAAQADTIALETIETLYGKRANLEALRACADFAARYPDHQRLPHVRLVEFRLAVRLGLDDEARARGYALWEGRVPGASESERWGAASLLSAHLVATGDLDAGLALYRSLFPLTRSDDDRRSILWRAGVAAFRAGQLDRAAVNLRSLMQRRPSGELEAAGLYWVAAVERALGRSAAADEATQRLWSNYARHYYGLQLAADAARGQSSLTFPELRLDAASRQADEMRAATLLAEAGLSTAAAEHAQRLLDQRRGERALALLTARAWASAGRFERVSSILAAHFGEALLADVRGAPDDFWSLVYPRPYWEAVRRAAEARGIDPYLLYALMRRESRFDARARSLAGAMGLFQIMPYTAAELGPAAGVGDLSQDEAALMDPVNNAAIAAELVGRLLSRFAGETAPVVAAYNAGEDRAGDWWQAGRSLSEVAFVDSIPYSETRRFVREVLGNYVAYRRLYRPPAD